MKWLALLMLIPLVAAGTEENPEITDPSGDAGNLGDNADLLAVWFDGIGETQANVHFKFDSLDTTSPMGLTAQLSFDVRAPLDPAVVSTPWMVEIEISPGTPTGVPVSGAELQMPADNGGTAVVNLNHVVRFGSPGYVDVEIPLDRSTKFIGSTLQGLSVVTSTNTYVGATTAELDAASSTAEVVMWGPGGISTIEPVGEPDIVGSTHPSLPTSVDMTGLWYDMTEQGPVITYQFVDLSPFEMSTCEDWRVNLWMYEGDFRLSVWLTLRVDDPWWSYSYIQSQKEVEFDQGSIQKDVPINVTMQFGEGGYLQLDVLDPLWEGPDELAGFDYLSTEVQCDMETGDIADELRKDRYDEFVEFTPVPIWLALTALVGLAFRRR